MSLLIQGKGYVVTENLELRKLQNGTNVLNFFVSVYDYSIKKDDNTYESKYSVHKCVAYGNLAEKLFKNGLKKTDIVLINGFLRVNVWENNEGKKNYDSYIRLESCEFISNPRLNNNNNLYKERQENLNKQNYNEPINYSGYDNSIPNPTDFPNEELLELENEMRF